LIAPVAGVSYNALAIDPNTPGTAMVSDIYSGRMWRTTNNGAHWQLMTRTQRTTEPN